MMSIELKIEPLTRDAFAPFGDVIETEGAHHFTINNGSTERFHDLAKIDVDDGGGRPIISVFRAQALDYPLAVKMVERHPMGSQAFIPMGDIPFLVVVAEAGDNPRPEQLRAFLATGGQGVNYHKGVWHHPILVRQPMGDFLVVDRGGEGHNCDEHFFPDADIVLAPKG